MDQAKSRKISKFRGSFLNAPRLVGWVDETFVREPCHDLKVNLRIRRKQSKFMLKGPFNQGSLYARNNDRFGLRWSCVGGMLC